MDEELFELTLWILAARDLLAESSEVQSEFASLLDFVDWAKYQAKKLLRSACNMEDVEKW